MAMGVVILCTVTSDDRAFVIIGYFTFHSNKTKLNLFVIVSAKIVSSNIRWFFFSSVIPRFSFVLLYIYRYNGSFLSLF